MTVRDPDMLYVACFMCGRYIPFNETEHLRTCECRCYWDDWIVCTVPEHAQYPEFEDND